MNINTKWGYSLRSFFEENITIIGANWPLQRKEENLAGEKEEVSREREYGKANIPLLFHAAKIIFPYLSTYTQHTFVSMSAFP